MHYLIVTLRASLTQRTSPMKRPVLFAPVVVLALLVAHSVTVDVAPAAETVDLLADGFDGWTYDLAKDVKLELVYVPAGSFAILMPQDAHMPGIAVTQPAPVRKVVVKVKV